MLSRQEIDSASIAALRTEVKLGNDHITFLAGTLSEWAELLLFSGAVMFVGSLLRFFLTLWRLNGVKNEAT